jgi:hypothetical protein
MTSFDSGVFLVETEEAALVIFDPKELVHRVRGPRSWWRQSRINELPEVLDGRIALAKIGRDGEYRIRVGTALTELEQSYVKGELTGFGLKVSSSAIFVGPVERISGDGRGERLSSLPRQGELLNLPIGQYLLRFVVLDWRLDKGWFEEGRIKSDAPPDFILVLNPLEGALADPGWGDELPSLLSLRARPQQSLPPVPPGPAPALTRPANPFPTGRQRSAPNRSGSSSGLKSLLEEQLSAALTRGQGQTVQRGVAELIAMPSRKDTKEQSWPYEEILRKVTRVREQMRVLEQKVNSGDLSLEARLELDAAITAVGAALFELAALPGERPPG